MLPLDVGNYREDSTIRMNIFWFVIYLTSTFLIFIVLSFGIFYYESDEEREFVSLFSLKILINF